jgi:hypothetical protein
MPRRKLTIDDFKFSLEKTIMLINGIFINTVIGYDLKSPIIPSSLIIFLMH